MAQDNDERPTSNIERPMMNKKNKTEYFLFLFIGFDTRAENLNLPFLPFAFKHTQNSMLDVRCSMFKFFLVFSSLDTTPWYSINYLKNNGVASKIKRFTILVHSVSPHFHPEWRIALTDQTVDIPWPVPRHRRLPCRNRPSNPVQISE